MSYEELKKYFNNDVCGLIFDYHIQPGCDKKKFNERISYEFEKINNVINTVHYNAKGLTRSEIYMDKNGNLSLEVPVSLYGFDELFINKRETAEDKERLDNEYYAEYGYDHGERKDTEQHTLEEFRKRTFPKIYFNKFGYNKMMEYDKLESMNGDYTDSSDEESN